MEEVRSGYVNAPELDEQVNKPTEATLENTNISPARLDGESYADYKIRRALAKQLIKQHMRGRLSYMSNVYFNGQLVTVAPPYRKDNDGKEDNSHSA